MICADVRIHWYGTHTTRSADTLDPNVGSKHPTALTPSRLHRNRSFSSYAEGHADVDLLGCCPTPSVSRRIGSYSTSRELTSPIFAQPHCSSAIIRAVRRGASKDVRTMLWTIRVHLRHICILFVDTWSPHFAFPVLFYEGHYPTIHPDDCLWTADGFQPPRRCSLLGELAFRPFYVPQKKQWTDRPASLPKLVPLSRHPSRLLLFLNRRPLLLLCY